MNNEQITEDVMNLKAHQAQNDTKIDNIISAITELKEDVKSTKNLAEDVHIMAINISNMQKTLEATNQKVDTLTQKDFKEYEANKKIIKDKILSAVAGGIGTGIIAFGIWFVNNFVK